MREYEYCLDTCSLYVSGDTYIRRKIWMDGDGYRGKDTRPHTDIVKIIEICVSDLAQNLNVDPDTDLQPGCQ